MKNPEYLQQGNIAERENKLLNPDEQDKNIMLQAISEQFANNDIWETIIVASEMALAGFEVKTLLQEAQIKKMKEELQQLREKIKEEPDPEKYIDLARCVYRFQNIGIDYPELNDEELDKLKSLPEQIRTNNVLPKAHLAYIPQIASALDQDIETLKNPTDANIIRKEIELDIKAKAGDELQFHSMVIGGGLLTQFDQSEAKKLIESEAWRDGREWSDILNYFEKIKKEKDGWKLARLLPPMQSLIKLHQQKN